MLAPPRNGSLALDANDSLNQRHAELKQRLTAAWQRALAHNFQDDAGFHCLHAMAIDYLDRPMRLCIDLDVGENAIAAFESRMVLLLTPSRPITQPSTNHRRLSSDELLECAGSQTPDHHFGRDLLNHQPPLEAVTRYQALDRRLSGAARVLNTLDSWDPRTTRWAREIDQLLEQVSDPETDRALIEAEAVLQQLEHHVAIIRDVVTDDEDDTVDGPAIRRYATVVERPSPSQQEDPAHTPATQQQTPVTATTRKIQRSLERRASSVAVATVVKEDESTVEARAATDKRFDMALSLAMFLFGCFTVGVAAGYFLR